MPPPPSNNPTASDHSTADSPPRSPWPSPAPSAAPSASSSRSVSSSTLRSPTALLASIAARMAMCLSGLVLRTRVCLGISARRKREERQARSGSAPGVLIPGTGVFRARRRRVAGCVGRGFWRAWSLSGLGEVVSEVVFLVRKRLCLAGKEGMEGRPVLLTRLAGCLLVLGRTVRGSRRRRLVLLSLRWARIGMRPWRWRWRRTLLRGGMW